MARIRPVSDDAREISGVGVWTPFRKASEWQRCDIPRRPGLYNVIAVGSDGNPAKVPIPAGSDAEGIERAERALRDDFPGVFYVGKACNLKDRFWKLIRSWKDPDKVPSNCHGSRKTWADQPQTFRSDHPFDRMRFRYKTVSSSDWEELKRAAKDGGIKALLGGVPTEGTPLGHNREFDVVSHLAIAEYKAIERYHRFAGALPPLNLISGEHPGAFPDQTWWLEHQREQDRLARELDGLFEVS